MTPPISNRIFFIIALRLKFFNRCKGTESILSDNAFCGHFARSGLRGSLDGQGIVLMKQRGKDEEYCLSGFLGHGENSKFAVRQSKSTTR
jgi:hypothetical protein